MSQVSHDSIWIRQYGAIHGSNLATVEKETGDNEKEVIDNKTERNDAGDNKIRKKTKYHNKDTKVEANIFIHEEFKKSIRIRNAAKATDNNASKNIKKIINHKENNVSFKNKTAYREKKKKANYKIFNKKANPWKNVSFITDKKTTDDKIIKKEDSEETENRCSTKTLKRRDDNQKVFVKKRNYTKTDVDKYLKKRPWNKQKREIPLSINNAGSVLKTTNEFNKRTKWSLNSGILISLVMLNVAGPSNAIDTSGFSSALTSRVLASFLGYPATCSLGAEVRPCTLTLTCWLRGGTRLRGCGGWLFSCCGPPEPNREGFDNSIPSSDWKYKMSPPKLRQVPQRNVMANNVFRRRVDDDVTQMDCGLPSSRILQKRIIGGREARFAEFPWQAHVRISEFQCGGVLVSRRYVATAAHCVSRAHTRDIAVWLGAIDTSATHHPARKLGVIQKILHPLFQFRMTQPDRYDIALLKLSRPITYMSHILPICLPDYDMELRGRSGVIAGWGKTDASNGHTGTNLLRSANVPILSKEQCINWHQSKQISVEIHSEMICAGHSDGHQDACLGDSGGPLIVLDNGRYYLVGITSAGFGCGVDHQPGIYHNVKLTANWIRGVISPSVNYIDT